MERWGNTRATAFWEARAGPGVKRPTIEDAKTMPREYYELPSDVLLTLAASGDYGSKEEILIHRILNLADITLNNVA